MIKELNIKNFAIIDSLLIRFNPTFNVITGDTGAGKTLIIKAVDILLGSPINRKMIRDSDKELEISGKFILNSDELEISRIYKKDRSYSMINGNRVSNSDLLKYSSSLIQFQRQHDSNDLLDDNKHISLLDSYIEDKKKFEDLKLKFHNYINDKKEYDDMVNNAEAYADKMNLYKFQIDELNSVILDANEEFEVNKKYKQYVNSKDIIDIVNQYVELNDSPNYSPINNIEKNIKTFTKYKTEDQDINSVASRLESVLVELKDIRDDVSSLESKYYFNEDEKKIIEEKVAHYEEIKRKYGGSIKSAIKYRDDLNLEFEGNFSFEEKISDLKNKKELSEEKYLDKAKEISQIRKETAITMESKINHYLSKVDMPDSKLKILINSNKEYKENGTDQCEIYVITNKGEEYKPLREIASGGEISRIMLSLSLVLSNLKINNTLIFDEVDTGISGSTASSIGALLKDLSNKKQLIVITHLPQIASKASAHLYAYKQTKESRTIANIKKLDSSDRQREVARMLSGIKITEYSLKQAERFILDG